MKYSFLFTGLIASLFLFTACENQSNEGEGGKKEEIRQATFDKPEYYPFDIVTVQLPDAATAETYNGVIGSQPVTAQRIADSTLVVSLPQLPAGDYTLSLQTGQSKTEGSLKIIALPVVSNPEAVIAEAKTTFSQMVVEAQQAGDSNAGLLASLTSAFDNQLAQLSETEKQQLAAYLQTHPEYSDFSALSALRSTAGEREDAMRAAIADYMSKVLRQKVNVIAFTAGLIAIPTTGLLGGAVCVIAAISIIQTQRALIASTNNVLSQAFILDRDLGLRLQSSLRSATKYDYTFTNGNVYEFDVQASYRSIAAKDISSPAPAEAKQIISSTGLFQTLWDEIANGINTLRNYCGFVGEMSGRPKKVSEITTPNNTTSDMVDNWTLSITSGNVSAQKSGNNVYKFTTSEKEDVEFKFKIMAEGMESEVYSGLLKVEEECAVCGTWKYIKQVWVGTWIESGEPYYDEYDWTEDNIQTSFPSWYFDEDSNRTIVIHSSGVPFYVVSVSKTSLVIKTLTPYSSNSIYDVIFYFERVQ